MTIQHGLNGTTPMPLAVDSSGRLTQNVDQIGGSSITLQGGAGGGIPFSLGTNRIAVAAGGNLSLNGSTRIDDIWLYPIQNPPGTCTLNSTSGPNHTLIGGNVASIVGFNVGGKGPLGNVSHAMTLNLGANVTAIVVASGGNASAGT